MQMRAEAEDGSETGAAAQPPADLALLWIRLLPPPQHLCVRFKLLCTKLAAFSLNL